MKPTFHCIPCHINHCYKIVSQLAIPDEDKKDLMLELTSLVAKNYSCPPDCAHELYAAIAAKTGIVDPLKDVKRHSNEIMMKITPHLKKMINTHEPMKQAMRISAVANLIDYGIGANTYEIDLNYVKEKIECIDIPQKFYERFVKTLGKSEKILFVGDNAGEIVADTLFIEMFPSEKVTFVVRGGPIINDATIEDAVFVGLTKKVKVISTGDTTPGINLHRCSEEFLNAFAHADMVILKGQGNFETMIDVDLSRYVKRHVSLFFIFTVKCIPVSQYVGLPIGESVFIIREL